MDFIWFLFISTALWYNLQKNIIMMNRMRSFLTGFILMSIISCQIKDEKPETTKTKVIHVNSVESYKVLAVRDNVMFSGQINGKDLQQE